MKTLFAAAAIAAAVALSGPVSAQMYRQPIGPAPMQQPVYAAGAMGTPSWMQDDGSSSDYPIHNPGDFSGDALNAQYQGGIPTAPGTGFPAGYPR